MWYRVFGLSDAEPSPADLAARLHAAGFPVEPHFKGDDLGWTEGRLQLSGRDTPLTLARYLTDADDLRKDLNAHAADLESRDAGPVTTRLMTHVVQTKQLITLQSADATDDAAALLLTAACRFLAAATDGVYQIDGRGWFTAAGELLLEDA